MSERLLGIPRSIALFGLVGLAAAIVLYGRGLGITLPRYELSKAAIVARAAEFAAAHGADTRGALGVAQSYGGDSDVFNELVSRYGIAEIRERRANGSFRLPAWRVRFRKDMFGHDLGEDRAGLEFTLDEHGGVLAAKFHEPHASEPAPQRDEARRIAVERLAAMGFDLTGFAERTDEKESAIKVSKTPTGVRVDVDPDKVGQPPPSPQATGTEDDDDKGEDEAHDRDAAPNRREAFVWERVDALHPELRVAVSATVTASGLTEFHRSIKFDETRAISGGRVAKVAEFIAFGLVATFLVISLFGVFLSRLINRDYVSVLRGLVVAGAFAATIFVSGTLASGFDGSLVSSAVAEGFLAVFSGVLVWSAWIGGEADAYFAWGRRSTEAAIALFSGQYRALQIARSALEGYFWGWIMLGVLAAGAATVAAFGGPDAVRRFPDMFAVDVHPTALFSLALLPYVLFFSVVCLLFVPAWAHRITQRAWIAIPVGAAVASLFAWIFELANVTFAGLSPSPSWALPFAAACCSLAARRGWLTATTAVFAFTAFYYGLAPIAVATPRDAAMAAVGLAIASLPAAGALAFGRRLVEVAVREAPPPRLSRLMEVARREEELDIARRVQSSLLPGEDPTFEGFDIAGTCKPAHEVGGDYFDYFALPDGRFGVAVGDVSGKGVPAAFCMTLTKGFMEVAASESGSPDVVLSLANSHLRRTLTRNTFVTMAYAVLDPESRSVVCARAGHNPPAVVRNGSGPTFVSPPGTALGAAPEDQFAELIEPSRIELDRGDTLVLYTDGVTEAMNATREPFGEQRLLAALERLADGRSARRVIDGLLSELDDYARDADQHDDITIVVIKAA